MTTKVTKRLATKRTKNANGRYSEIEFTMASFHFPIFVLFCGWNLCAGCGYKYGGSADRID